MELHGRELRVGVAGAEVAQLHDELTELGYVIAQAEHARKTFGDSTAEAVRAFQRQHRVPDTGVVDAETAAAVLRALEASGRMAPGTQTVYLGPSTPSTPEERTVLPTPGMPPGGPAEPRPAESPPGRADSVAVPTPADDRTVDGVLYTEAGLPAAGLALRLYHKGFGCADTRLGESTTGAEGNYYIGYSWSGPANVEMRAVDEAGAEVTLMRIRYDAPEHVTLNLVVPPSVAGTAPEHQRLLGDLHTYLGREGNLGDAKEDDACHDITLLSRDSGWDGRLVALAARAEQLAAQTGVNAQALYALLRAGLPADAAQLARLAAELQRLPRAGSAEPPIGGGTPGAAELSLIDQAFAKARQAGIVELSDADVAAARDALAEHAKAYRLANVAAPGTMSTVGSMLTASGLTAAEQDTFDALAAAYYDDPAMLWRAAGAAGISAAKIDMLRLQGKLACLTLNNARLITALGPIGDLPKVLLSKDLHTAEAWHQVIYQAGGSQIVPAAYTGDDKVVAYAEDLARKVRIALPTQVVTRRIEKGELTVPGAPQQLAQVLDKAAGEFGFRFGSTPTLKFLSEHGDALLSGLSEADAAAAGRAMSTLQRVYQITPDDQAMKALLDAGLTSAYLVTSDDKFVEKHADKVGGPAQAALILNKAQQVSAVVYNAFAAISQAAASPVVYAIAAPPEQSDSSKNNIAKHYPTLQELFGNLDFCECEHCRSVLSPAAYLVDLLRFLDPDPAIWPGGATPYDKLIDRRPDLPELALTCENTNVALPYIDIVNEIMEFSVAGQELSARDVGKARAEDLLAEPQYVIPQAYTNLLAELYFPLPFNLWHETVRGFLNALGVPFADLLEALCPTDDLDPPGGEKYGQRSVLLERLGLTPAEYAVHAAPSDQDWYKLYGYADSNTALAELRGAKTLALKLDISYVEVAEIVRGSFVNPGVTGLATMRKLGLEAEDVRRYLGGLMSEADHDALVGLLGDAGVDDNWLASLWDTDLKQALTLTDTEPGCSFDYTIIRRGGGDETSVTALDLKRINLLVRLRKRLGWTYAEIDTALSALQPANPNSLGDAMANALVHLSRLDTLTRELNVGRDARIKLLTLWRPMPVPLYEQLFLAPSVKAQDEALDNALAQYLSTPNVLLSDHLTVIQGALGLTSDEIKLILDDNFTTVETAPLEPDTVALLYRYRLLAQGLKMSISDVIVLRGLSGEDPFLPGDTEATSRFVDYAQLVKSSGIKLDELDYLLRERFDRAGPLRPQPEVLLGLVRTLVGGMARINAAYPDPADALAYTDEQLAQQLPLVLPADVATMFLGMWTGTAIFHASASTMTPLQPAGYASEQALTVSYDSVRNLQWLSYRGVLVDAEYTRLKTDHPDATFIALLDLIMPQASDFFEAHLTGDVGPFVPADFGVLFDPAAGEPGQLARRTKLANGFLPYLRAKLIDALIIDTASAMHSPVREFVSELLQDQDLVSDPSETAPLLAAYQAIGEPGLTVTYYASADGSDPPMSTATVSDVDTSVKPNGAGSAVYKGYLEVPTPGAYAFIATVGAGTTVELSFDHLADPLLSGTNLEAFTELRTGTAYQMKIFAGGLSTNQDVTVKVRADGLANGAIGRLTCYPASHVERLRRADSLLAKVLWLCSALELTEPVLRELDWLDLNDIPTVEIADSASTGLFKQFTRLAEFSQLRADVGATADELIEVFRYAKRIYASTADFNSAKAEVLAGLCQRFGDLTRRTADVVELACTELGITADADTITGIVTVAGFRSEHTLRQLWTVLSQAQTLGVAPDELGRWAKPAPVEADAVDLRATLKARYEPDAWRRVAKPVSDALRRERRDALVAYLMQQKGFEAPNELYEHFLVDPGTEPVVQTSRLRQAVSSVQLFIQRCLLNMESPGVLPSSINASQWEWMKRYRIWEANRKIFLWPENWLEPEWRDDKTHLFTELEGTLLQGEVTADLAEDALFAYLTGLEEIARLEIMSTWLEEPASNPAYNKLHVLARTHQQPHKYFYRLYENLQWTAWQRVNADIEGDHVVLAVWRQRPCVFWVSFLDRAIIPDSTSVSIPADGSSADLATTPPRKDIDVSLNWCEQVQGEWKPSNSSGFGKPLTFSNKDVDFDRNNLFIHVSVTPTEDSESVRILLTDGGEAHQAASSDNWIEIVVAYPQSTQQASLADDQLSVVIGGSIGNGFEMTSRNSPARVVYGSDPVSPPFTWSLAEASQYHGGGALHVWYTSRIDGTKETKTDTDVLATGPAFSLVTPPSNVVIAAGRNPEIGSLIRPFFYQTDHDTFYVDPSLTEKSFVEWDGWILDIPAASSQPNYELDINVAQTKPIGPPPKDPDPLALYAIKELAADYVLGQGVALQYGQKVIWS